MPAGVFIWCIYMVYLYGVFTWSIYMVYLYGTFEREDIVSIGEVSSIAPTGDFIFEIVIFSTIGSMNVKVMRAWCTNEKVGQYEVILLWANCRRL